jgi:hypothetical protein
MGRRRWSPPFSFFFHSSSLSLAVDRGKIAMAATDREMKAGGLEGIYRAAD